MRVFWFLSGGKDRPSSRIHGYNIHEYLIGQGVASYLICQPSHSLKDFPGSEKAYASFLNEFVEGDVIVIQKLHGSKTQKFLKAIKNTLAKTVFIDCDIPVKREEAILCDLIVCPSKFLMELYISNGFENTIYIPDSPEVFLPPKKSATNKLKCVWFGLPGEQKWQSAMELKQIISSEAALENWELVTISNTTAADFLWDRNSYSLINSFHAVVVPLFRNNNEAFAKSANRVLQGMALGLPVLASPLPAYCEVIANGENGFICKEKMDWVNNLKLLGDNEKARKSMAMKAYEFTLNNFGVNVIGARWKEALSTLANGEPSDALANHLPSKFKSRVFYEMSKKKKKNPYRLQYALKSFFLDPSIIKSAYTDIKYFLRAS